MSNLLAKIAVGTYFVAALGTMAFAEMQMAGDIQIETPMLRETPPNAPVAGGFLALTNTGEVDDTLIAAAIAPEVAGMVQLHEMVMSEGVMSMSEIAGGIPVPVGETVTLMPGGLHIMLMQMQQPLTAGESYPVTLTFENAGDVTLDFPVLTLGDIRDNIKEAGVMEGTGHGDGHSDGAHSGHGN